VCFLHVFLYMFREEEEGGENMTIKFLGGEDSSGIQVVDIRV